MMGTSFIVPAGHLFRIARSGGFGSHPSVQFFEGRLQSRSDSIDWSVPIYRRRPITPSHVRRIKDDLIPMESFLHAALRRWLA
jgi:hypothetical protein